MGRESCISGYRKDAWFLEKFDYFYTDDNVKYLVLSLIDRDLMNVMYDQEGQKLDLKSTLMIGIQTVSIYSLFCFYGVRIY